jgi:hypothetical protein
MTSITELQQKCPDRMLRVHEQAKPECGYSAARFRNRVLDQGRLDAAKNLLASGGYSEGLTRLWEEQRLDISLEATVLQKPWRELFSDEELTIAVQTQEELG